MMVNSNGNYAHRHDFGESCFFDRHAGCFNCQKDEVSDECH